MMLGAIQQQVLVLLVNGSQGICMYLFALARLDESQVSVLTQVTCSEPHKLLIGRALCG